MKRTWPIIGVRDVPGSFHWYQSLFGQPEHNLDTLLVHISDEDGRGWTTLAIDRETREWSIAQRNRQQDAAKAVQ